MADEPTPGEVSRAIERLLLDNRDEHERLRRGLGHKVDRDVYEADKRRWDDRYDTIQTDLARERDDFQKWRDRRDEWRKWIIGLCILPVGGLIVEIISLLRSWH